MIWVPPLEFDPYCRDKSLLLQNELTTSIELKKTLQKLWTKKLWKSKNPIFSKTAQPIEMTEIYVIEGTEKVIQ